MRAKMAVLLSMMFLLASCTTVVSGTGDIAGEPSVNRHNGVASGEPCALLPPEHAAALGYEEEGEFTAGKSNRYIPPSCRWEAADPLSDLSSLTVEFATDIPLAGYTDGEELMETFELGGLTWERYTLPFGDSSCLLVTELSEMSFVSVVSSSSAQEENACDAAKAAAPYIASQLPGGDPDPPHAPSAAPDSPVSVDACSLLRPEQAEQLGRTAEGKPVDPEPRGPGCRWGADRDSDLGGMYIRVNTESDPRQREDAESLDVSGREWRLAPASVDGMCTAVFEATEELYVEVTVHGPDTEAACAGTRDAVPLITENLSEF